MPAPCPTSLVRASRVKRAIVSPSNLSPLSLPALALSRAAYCTVARHRSGYSCPLPSLSLSRDDRAPPASDRIVDVDMHRRLRVSELTSSYIYPVLFRSAMGTAAVLVVSRSVEGQTTRIAFDSVAACTDGGDSGSVSWSDRVAPCWLIRISGTVIRICTTTLSSTCCPLLSL